MALKFRRGTTAQKSGSLAVGEPYINYDLQTLQIGTDQGDVTLSTTSPTATSAIASLSASNFVSSSYLHVVNDATIKGNVTIGGTIQIGDQSSDVVNVVASLSSSLIPETDNTFDLGSLTKSWRDLYISTGSIKMVSNGVVISTLSNTANGFTLDQGVIANGNSSFGTSSAAVTSITGSLRVSGSINLTGSTIVDRDILLGKNTYLNNPTERMTIGQGKDNNPTNVAIGRAVLDDLQINDNTTAGMYNVGVGSYALTMLSTGKQNTSIGESTLVSLVAGNSNTALGDRAGNAFNDGNGNTFLGAEVGRMLQNGSYNIGIGQYSLLGAQGTTTNFVQNIAIGVEAGQNLSGSSSANIIIGKAAGPQTPAEITDRLYIGHMGYPLLTGSLAEGNLSLGINGSTYVSGALSASTLTGIGNVTSYSSSVNNRVASLESFSSSLNSGFATDAELTIVSASAWGAFQSASSYSASAASTYAVKGAANTFTGNQTVTGSVYVSGDLIVQGSSSLQNITASAVSIGTNTVLLNTNNPSVRYGGISVIDSGSSSTTGSLLWDSTNNVWIYVNPSGSSYTSARLISGPKSNTQGSETGLTTNTIQKAVGDDHIGDSIITEVGGNTINIAGAVSASTFTGLGNLTEYSTSVDLRLLINSQSAWGAFQSASAFSQSCSTNTITINGVAVALGGTLTQAQTINGAISTSAQIDHNSTTNYVANKHIDHTTVSISAGNGMSGGGDISSTRTLTLDTASAHFLSGSRAGLSVVDTTGASGIDLTYNAGLGTLSGVLANSSVTINGSSVSLGGSLTTAQVLAGAFSSSAQVDLTATTNYGTYINQAVKTTSSPTFAGLTINGSITATGDITAYYTSDRRFKDNVQTIPNALEKVKALNGVTWDWAESASDVTKAAPTTGLIAQEVQEVLPQVVKEKEDGFLGLDYSKMIGLLVEAIKEQQYKIDTLQAELEGIKNSNN